jgi:hypothetical protein
VRESAEDLLSADPVLGEVDLPRPFVFAAGEAETGQFAVLNMNY